MATLSYRNNTERAFQQWNAFFLRVGERLVLELQFGFFMILHGWMTFPMEHVPLG